MFYINEVEKVVKGDELSSSAANLQEEQKISSEQEALILRLLEFLF